MLCLYCRPIVDVFYAHFEIIERVRTCGAGKGSLHDIWQYLKLGWSNSSSQINSFHFKSCYKLLHDTQTRMHKQNKIKGLYRHLRSLVIMVVSTHEFNLRFRNSVITIATLYNLKDDNVECGLHVWSYIHLIIFNAELHVKTVTTNRPNNGPFLKLLVLIDRRDEVPHRFFGKSRGLELVSRIVVAIDWAIL